MTEPENAEAAGDGGKVPNDLMSAAAEVVRVAVPLMISAGMFSIVLFADRTLLLFYDGSSMSAAMAGGNLFWVLVCVPTGAASMTGAMIGQLIGNNESHKVGRLLWQTVWIAAMTIPWFVSAAMFAESMFRWSGQPAELIAAESTYLRWLMLGGLGLVVESALSGFFSGTERTSVIMWVSVASGLLNILLDVVLIFGVAGPELGIAGAAIGSVIAFWFKAVCYGWLLLKPEFESTFGIRDGFCYDGEMLWNFFYFSLASGLMYLTEAGAFTVIILRIGQLGDVPLRATTMAINFNMVAFIPLVGIAIAASVLVGRHLVQSGPKVAVRTTVASLLFALAYAGLWGIGYVFAGRWMMSLYRLGTPDEHSVQAIEMATGLLGFVALYVLVDAAQLILGAALKGAGDTWFVLGAGAATSLISVTIGLLFDPGSESLNWWWWVITCWVWSLAIAMITRFLGGRWKSMRMV